MLVDDEQDIISIFTRALVRKGIPVIGFTSPISALREFQQNPSKYALVVSDIKMPHMDGWELISHIKRLKAAVKVIMISAFEIDREMARGAAVDDYLRKPLSIDQLTNVIHRHLSGP